MYTSGTTGDPKGVMSSNSSIVAVIAGVHQLLRSVNESDVKVLVEDIGELKPTILCAVPRVLDRTYSGLTETCAGTFVSIPNEINMLGTVVLPCPLWMFTWNLFLKWGMILSRERHVEKYAYGGGGILFSGYFKQEDLTNEVMIDGWFHTGDIGEWQPNGSLKIIDHKKNIFKLSQGEFVAVENLENIYGLVPDIDSVWIYGNSFESFLIVIINPNKEAVEQWAEKAGISGDFGSLCENVKVKEYFLGELTRIAKAKKLKGFEFIKAVHLDPVPFDTERDLITPTFKKKRPQMLKYYQDIINNMYKSGK